MITIYGEGRGFRDIWLLEEMGLPYKLRPVDLLAGVENDPEFLRVNPGGFIPALVDGDVTMVESIAIMEYLLARYPFPKPRWRPRRDDPNFGLYQQFLHLGEAGLGANIQVVVVSGFVAPESERDNWGARWALDQFHNRMKLVKRQLARTPLSRGRHIHRCRHFGDPTRSRSPHEEAVSSSTKQSAPTWPRTTPDAMPISARWRLARPRRAFTRRCRHYE